MKNIFHIWLQIISVGFLYAQIKPVQGLIKGESDSTLTSVKIISMPSQTKINADKEGEFYFEMPVRDRKLIISHKNHYPDTVNAILFENHTKHNLSKVIAEIDTTDPAYLLSLIRDTLNSSKANPTLSYYDFSNEDLKNYLELNSLIYDKETYALSSNIGGSNYLNYRGGTKKSREILYDGIKINNLGGSFIDLNQFPSDELDGIEIVQIGHFKSMPSFGTINLIPKVDYGINAKARQSLINNNYNNYIGSGSLGFKYATINGTYNRQDNKINYQENDSLRISLLNDHSSLNLGIRKNKKLELRIMGFQNKTYFKNNKHNDSSYVTFNNIITKVVHKQRENALMSLYSLYQIRDSKENFDQMNFNKVDENISLGFGFEKGFEEALFSISAESNYIFSDWIVDSLDISNVRSNTNFSGSFIIQRPMSPRRLFLKNISLIFNRQHAKDTPDSSLNYFLVHENWEQSGSMFNIEFISTLFNETVRINSMLGNTYQIPTISDRILNQVISNVVSEKIITEESKSFFEFKLIKDFKSKTEQIPIFFSLKIFQYGFKNKVKYIYSLGSPFQIPMNIGEAYINGSEIEVKVHSKNKKYKISSSLLSYKKSDLKAFQLQPDLIFKNNFTTVFKKNNLTIIHKIESGSHLTSLSRGGVFYSDEIPLRNNVDFSISRSFKYKKVKFITQFSGENILNEPTQILDLKLFKSRYLMSFKFEIP